MFVALTSLLPGATATKLAVADWPDVAVVRRRTAPLDDTGSVQVAAEYPVRARDRDWPTRNEKLLPLSALVT